MWKSLDLLSSTYYFLWPMPLEWKKARQGLIYNSFSWKMVPWMAGILLLITFIQIPCLLLVSLNLFGVVDVPLKVMIITIIFIVLSVFGVVQNLGAILYGHNFVTGFNFLVAMEKGMTRKFRKKKWYFQIFIFLNVFFKICMHIDEIITFS